MLTSAVIRHIARLAKSTEAKHYVILEDGVYEYDIAQKGNELVFHVSAKIIDKEKLLALISRDGILSPMQARVSVLAAAGCTNDGIAKRLGMSPHTARRHVEAIFDRLRVRSRAGVAETLSRLIADSHSR
jgi:DNA-binding CsgD family transcriptional regulator